MQLQAGMMRLGRPLLLLQVLSMPYVRLHMKRYRDYVAREVDHRKQVGGSGAARLGGWVAVAKWGMRTGQAEAAKGPTVSCT